MKPKPTKLHSIVDIIDELGAWVDNDMARADETMTPHITAMVARRAKALNEARQVLVEYLKPYVPMLPISARRDR